MEENLNEENDENLNDNQDSVINEEEIEENKKDIESFPEEESKKIDLNDSLDEYESEFIEELEKESETIEGDEIAKGLDKDQESLQIEESIDEYELEDKSESALTDNQALELDEKAIHRNFIEAALYAAGGPLTIEELSNKLEFPKKEVEILVNELAFDYLERTTSLIIAQIGDRYQMQIRPEYTERVSKFAKGGAIAERYLRTLTIIALKQPILKSMVIKLRGSGAYEHIKYLLDNEFINATKKGRSHELTTTDKYAEMFGLPKDIRLMKQVMVKQLGIEEGGLRTTPAEVEEESQDMPISENEEGED